MKEENQSFLLFFSWGKEKGGSYGGRGPIGPNKGRVERFHIAEPKGSTSVRDRSMSRRLLPAA